jgi:hypothetical protein
MATLKIVIFDKSTPCVLGVFCDRSDDVKSEHFSHVTESACQCFLKVLSFVNVN